MNIESCTIFTCLAMSCDSESCTIFTCLAMSCDSEYRKLYNIHLSGHELSDVVSSRESGEVTQDDENEALFSQVFPD